MTLNARIHALSRNTGSRSLPNCGSASFAASRASGSSRIAIGSGAVPNESVTATLLKFGKLVLDTSARTLTAESGEVPLTNIEFRLLLELVKHPGIALSREALTRAAQVGNYRPLDRAVDVQIARLRRKLRQADDCAQWIATARGEGYVWAPPISAGQKSARE